MGRSAGQAGGVLVLAALLGAGAALALSAAVVAPVALAAPSDAATRYGNMVYVRCAPRA